MLFDQWKRSLTRSMVIEFMDRLPASALKSSHMIRDYSGLNKRRRPKVEGMVRFPMLEQTFEEICDLAGGELIGPVMPGTDLKIYQPLFRFGGKTGGMVLGLASMPDSGKLPTQNLTRKAGVKLNYFQSPRFDLGDSPVLPTDTFVLILVARDRARAGHLEVISVGVIDTEFSEFLYYVTLEEFLAGTTDAPEVVVAPSDAPDPKPTLRQGVKPFVPPEQIEGEGERKAN